MKDYYVTAFISGITLAAGAPLLASAWAALSLYSVYQERQLQKAILRAAHIARGTRL